MNHPQKDERVRERLLAERIRGSAINWKWLSDLDGGWVDRKRANKFLLGAALDYQMRANLVWENARRFAEDDLGDPDDLWENILAIPGWDSEIVFRRYRLHRFPEAHRRVRRIGEAIVGNYGGDSREIWRDQRPAEVRKRLERMRLGPQIARMVVGALFDTGQISGAGELKADLHVTRVLGRVFAGERVSVAEAHRIANRIMPDRSWMVDAPLYLLGKSRCRPTTPDCGRCYLRPECVYFEANS
ncbi:MAG: hypothetical protein OXI45_11150 [Acidobacteriota bacterium]|nr:hypothetical protein [Acidobacteriota bacterium]